ncbi:hypothetical protein [Haloarcula japonica]|uniref:Uncharacterized protein n=1 Tax=Haloarcula japonica (strain ATCC 49778 / DSM 6131 / JCM 7785 / NBRC 101032 / NCIMB 13157 / TR-1) TaxID=1227453 RepID=M0L596_HALJT|nr:hypothetical protein [Haloarcula japonica]EMA27589.1 hypothetical protein C444_18922 [Haloarcula japonica DSM 6131]
MATAQQGTEEHILTRYASVEIGTITSPCLIVLATATVVYNWPPAVLGWFVSGLLGLLIAVVSGRTSAIRPSLIKWLRAESRGDLAVNAIAYNGVLIIGTVLGQIVWTASNSLLLAAGVGAVLPVWFFKHIQFLVFLDGE